MDENNVNVTTGAAGVDEATTNEEMEALKAELEKERAEKERFKKSVDKLTKEAAEKSRAERAKMTEDEKRKADQEEEFNRLKEQAEADARELNHLKAVSAYKNLDEDMVEKLIDAISDKDHASIATMIDKVVEKAIKEKEAEWKKSRPAAIMGDGSFPTMTVEQIKAIKDPLERQRKIAENINLFS